MNSLGTAEITGTDLICFPMLRIGNGSQGFRFFASGRKSVSPFLKKGGKEAPDYRISIIEFV
jgi:hypothetical protein